jgi:non-specific serine/threonine protein kinase
MERIAAPEMPASRSTIFQPIPDDNRGNSGNLPAPLFSLIGREAEIVAACALLQHDDVRLLTFTGPGGVGKTQLALAVARKLSQDFADGAVFVSLASLNDPGLVVSAITQAVEVRDPGTRPLLDSLEMALRNQELLLLLDNFEHVIGAAPTVAALLAACPKLTVLVTSRVRTRISGEYEYVVPPLALPDTEQAFSVEAAMQSEAIRLFVARALAVQQGFALNFETTPIVAAICRRLDGLPLAIELAAARLKVLPPSALLARLEQRLPLLADGSRDVPVRLQSMRDAIAWSYDLLTSAEQTLFRRLAVFAGGFPLTAAEGVNRATDDGAPDTFAGIATLVDASLLRQVPGPDGEPRYMMLETIREFALERLASSGEEADMRSAHASWYLALAERAFQEVVGPQAVNWLPRFAPELENFRAALAWFAATEETLAGLQLASALDWFWMARGLLREERSWLEHFLTRAANAPLTVRCRALTSVGFLAYLLGDLESTEAYATEARDLVPQVGEAHLLFGLLSLLGAVAGELHHDYAQAEKYFNESLAVGRDAGLEWTVQSALNNLGIMAYAQGNLTRARTLGEEAVAHGRAADGWWDLSNNLGCLAMVVLRQGDCAYAARLLQEVLTLDQERGTDFVNEGVALLAAECGQAEQAARLYGANEVQAERNGVDPYATETYHSTHERAIATTRKKLGEQAFATAWTAGRDLSSTDMLAEAQEAIEVALTQAGATSSSPDLATQSGLSPRELEVVRLIAAGRSNQEIADALYISHGTATTHVRNILAKLNLDSRTAVAAWAIRNGLD